MKLDKAIMAQGNDGYLLTLMEKVSKLDYLSDVTLVAGIDREKWVSFQVAPDKVLIQIFYLDFPFIAI